MRTASLSAGMLLGLCRLRFSSSAFKNFGQESLRGEYTMEEPVFSFDVKASFAIFSRFSSVFVELSVLNINSCGGLILQNVL